MTCDGKIATKKMHSKWITNIKSRQYSHMLRHYSDAILVGASTVINDDPSLTTRLTPFKGINPIRIILDGKLRTPSSAKVYNDKLSQTILVTGRGHSKKKLEEYSKKGVNILELPDENNKIDLKHLLKILSEKSITSILIEGGAETSGLFIDAQVVDKIYVFISSKIAGGKSAVSAIGGLGIEKMEDACHLENLEVSSFDNDILLAGNITYKE
jgi:diaminohydroxyphosphoribosylaminopyrimidine deaminase/5-amino-6-(5-phosphoribosylamino)uracil reductase